MPEGDCKDQKALNKQEPNVPFTVEELKDLGIWYVHSLSLLFFVGRIICCGVHIEASYAHMMCSI